MHNDVNTESSRMEDERTTENSTLSSLNRHCWMVETAPNSRKPDNINKTIKPKEDESNDVERNSNIRNRIINLGSSRMGDRLKVTDIPNNTDRMKCTDIDIPSHVSTESGLDNFDFEHQ